MAIIKNNLYALLLKKGQKENRLKPNGEPHISHIQRELKAQGLDMAYPMMHDWIHDKLTRFDRNVLARWCVYLDCTPGDILTLVADDAEPASEPSDADSSRG